MKKARERLAEQLSEADKRAQQKVQMLLQLHEQREREAEDLRQQLCAAKASSSRELAEVVELTQAVFAVSAQGAAVAEPTMQTPSSGLARALIYMVSERQRVAMVVVAAQ